MILAMYLALALARTFTAVGSDGNFDIAKLWIGLAGGSPEHSIDHPALEIAPMLDF
jgi:hypothetical protein